jgi:hypothetical protein
MTNSNTWTLDTLNSNFIDDLKEETEITIICYKAEYEEYEGFFQDIKKQLEDDNYELEYEFYEDEDFENQGELTFSCYEICDDDDDDEENTKT